MTDAITTTPTLDLSGTSAVPFGRLIGVESLGLLFTLVLTAALGTVANLVITIALGFAYRELART